MDTDNSVGAAWGDYDGDGWPDLFVTNSSNQNNCLYRNNGDGTFTKNTTAIVGKHGGHSHGVNWIDIDNDGDLDLFVTNDEGPNFLYINDGSGNFTREEEEEIATDMGLNYGQAWADEDRDGFLDLMLSFHSNQPDRVYCNKTNSNHWINIKLQGSVSNYSAIGTRVRIKANGHWQERQVYPITGFGSQNSLRQHFGLGDATSIDSIEVHWPSGIEQYSTNVSADQFITLTEEAGNEIQGVAFHDLNGNCTWDTGEPFLSGVHLAFTEANVTTSTDEAGGFTVHLVDGDYTWTLQSGQYWQTVCTRSFTVNSASTTVNLPLQPTTAGYDLEIAFGATAWRRGFVANSMLQYRNNGSTTAENVVLDVVYPAEVNLQSATPTGTQTATNTYRWSLGSLAPGEYGTISLTDSVTLNSTVGQLLTITATIEADGTDLNTLNNTTQEEIEVVGAIDPNDISVSPRGEGDAGYISKHQRLTYHIRFQNVGTYKATYVRIENKLPEHLDLATFKIVEASHHYRYSIDNHGVLRVYFDHINLPDSTQDEPGSHGSFTYSIVPLATLTGGEAIINNARIYFDYEDGIRTNTVLSTIQRIPENLRGQLVIYPNPASLEINLSVNQNDHQYSPYISIKQIYIYNQQGLLKLNMVATEDEVLKVNTSSLPHGFYIVRILDANNQVYTGKLVIQ